MSTSIVPRLHRSPPSSDSDDDQDDIHAGDIASSSSGWEDQNELDDRDETLPLQCLFCDLHINGSARDVFKHCKSAHNFDWYSIVREQGLDFYDKVKLINYLRTHAIVPTTIPTKDLFSSDKYLKPVLENDPLLFELDDDEGIDVTVPAESNNTSTEKAKASPSNNEPTTRELRQELAALQQKFLAYREQVAESFMKEVEQRGVVYEQPVAKERDDDSHYFQSYSGNDIHETMLKDSVRTEAYRDFIYENKHIFKDKVVLDVGCGTGILSMFCAKAGASKVFAVDNSDIIDKARENVFENSLDGKIKCLRGKIEEIELPVKQVDIIVSEWMGYCLLYEAMLDSVLFARDKYLSPTGLMVPSECRLLIAAMHDSDYMNDSVHFWNNVYGFRMTSMKERIREDVVISHLNKSSLASDTTVFLNLPLHTIKKEDLSFTKPFEVEIRDNVESLDAFVIYFDNYFAVDRNITIADHVRAESWSGEGNAFTTGPGGKETHWKQGVLMVQDGGVGLLNTGQKIAGEVTYRKAVGNSRELEIEVEWELVGKGGKKKQLWHMR